MAETTWVEEVSRMENPPRHDSWTVNVLCKWADAKSNHGRMLSSFNHPLLDLQLFFRFVLPFTLIYHHHRVRDDWVFK